MKKSIISIILAVVMVLGMTSISAFAAENTITAVTPTDINYTDHIIQIDSPEELLWVSEYSRNATDDNIPATFKGWTIEVTDTINYLNNDWTPITYFFGTMKGVPAAGSDYVTISGLKVEGVSTGAGLCGNMDAKGGAHFEAICISNSTFTASGKYAGAFVGNGFTSSFKDCRVENCTISASRFVGGIVGTTYGNIIGCTVTGNTSVSSNNPNATLSYFASDNVGGIIGLMGEGGMKIEDCTVDGVVVKGNRQVGGIAGLANYGNNIIDCHVLNSEIYAGGKTLFGGKPQGHTTPAVGGVVGQFGAATSSQKITVTGNEVKNVTITQAYNGTAYIGWAIGDANSYGSDSANLVISGNSHENVVGKIGTAVTTINEVGYNPANPSLPAAE